MPRRHEIPSTPQNMVWGYLDSDTPHILEVNSGDTVTLHSFPSGGKETLPDDINLVPRDYLDALETLPPGPGSHFLTGPVYVRGAGVGDTLQIDILDVKVRQDWGFVSILPLLGTLPEEFTEYETPENRPATQRLHHALGKRDSARAVLRDHRHRAAAELGPLRVARPTRVRRKHG